MDTEQFRVVVGPFYRPAQYARAQRHSTIEAAVAAMGTGMVLGDGERLVAFHESHLPIIERRATASTSRP